MPFHVYSATELSLNRTKAAYRHRTVHPTIYWSVVH